MTDEEWGAISRRDGSYDGRFFYGRKTTKKVCRPSCPVRLCSPKNIIIFRTFEEAADAGYTPCRRCRPDLPWWNGASAELAETARRYIDRHYAEKFSLEAIAGSLYVNGSYLTRIFRKYGYSFRIIAVCKCESARYCIV